MIYYMNLMLPQEEHFWRPVPEHFKATDIHKPHICYQINGTVYFGWSEQYEQAVTWEKLKGK